ncbi:MAG TPA: hypothetical protein DEF45_06475 [Rhodopirellula sp.]|nr:MAG: hypothetical protein CBD74_12475 [Saprospirales bacterium TMED214]HBV62651.1 hypothetical protein [Rhodopirellula sp.]
MNRGLSGQPERSPASQTSETDYQVAAPPLLRPNTALQTDTEKCSQTQIQDTDTSVYRDPKGIILPFR